MFARFTEQAHEAMDLAQKEAGRLRHPWLGTEHLLLALLSQSDTSTRGVLDGLAVTRSVVERELQGILGEPPEDEILGTGDERALRTLGIDLHVVRARVEETFGQGALERARPGRCGVPMMPRLKQSLERAAREAGRGSIETDHLLLGMIQVRSALAVELLERLGVTPDAVRMSVQARRARAG